MSCLVVSHDLFIYPNLRSGLRHLPAYLYAMYLTLWTFLISQVKRPIKLEEKWRITIIIKI